MKSFPFRRNPQGAILSTTLLALLVLGMSLTAHGAPKSVSKWEVFEEMFRSSHSYENPPQQARLTVDFVSPSGQTHRIHGYWDGGSRWGVRFCPDELGPWTYTTDCTDARNSGLNGKSGQFLCTVQSFRTRLQQHGSIVAPPGMATFQYADGTPFFWLADNVWNGARKATREEWADYVRVRSNQKFNVALWRAAPGMDDRNRQAFDGTNFIRLNTGFLKDLGKKIIRLNEADMVSAIAPLWEIGVADEDLLPEDQVIVMLRQMVARWDAYQVAWVIAFEADTNGRRAARWRRIGRSVFDQFTHSPVILFCGSKQWALKDFSNESWVNAVAFQSGNDVSEGASLWLTKGPASSLWREEPVRPVLNLIAATEAGFTEGNQTINSREAVESLALSLFAAPPAGVCYQSQAIAQWNDLVDTNTVAVTGARMAEWQKSLFLPGARRAVQISDFFMTTQSYRLKPADSVLLPTESGDIDPVPLAALAAHSRDRALFFVPEGQTVRIVPKALRSGLQGRFFSLWTGAILPTEPDQADLTKGITPPGPGHWLLSLTPNQP